MKLLNEPQGMFETGFMSPNLQKYLPTACCYCQPYNVRSSQEQLADNERE